MVKVIYGKEGMGKTKILVDTANKLAEESLGDVVFIDDSNQLMYDLKHNIRFINVADFPIAGIQAFIGFLCGVISENYDIDGIFIDGLTNILHQDITTLEEFFNSIKNISEKFNVKFHISLNGDDIVIPEYLKEYIA